MVHFQPNCEEGGDIRVAWSTPFISRSHLSCLHPNYFQKLKTKVYVHARHKIWNYFCRSGMEVFFGFFCLFTFLFCLFFLFFSLFLLLTKIFGYTQVCPSHFEINKLDNSKLYPETFLSTHIFIVKPTVTDYVRVNKYSLYLSTAYFFLINYFTLCKD